MLQPEVLDALQDAQKFLQPIYEFYVKEQEFMGMGGESSWKEVEKARSRMPFESFLRFAHVSEDEDGGWEGRGGRVDTRKGGPRALLLCFLGPICASIIFLVLCFLSVSHFSSVYKTSLTGFRVGPQDAR